MESIIIKAVWRPPTSYETVILDAFAGYRVLMLAADLTVSLLQIDDIFHEVSEIIYLETTMVEVRLCMFALYTSRELG